MATHLVHIVDRFEVPWSGSALSALALGNLLGKDAAVRFWSLDNPHSCYQNYSILPINTAYDRHPTGGTLVIHGSHYDLGPWVPMTDAERVILVCNVHGPSQLFRNIAKLREAGLPEPEIAYRSRALRDQAAIEGIIEPPLIDIDLFRPDTSGARDRFTIGRMSRDNLGKHNEDDPSLYRMLAASGCRLRIMGGTCLEPYLGPDRVGIELLETGSMPAHRFLQGLDCFFYRTGTLEEAFGRVLLEAMATGLPVVAHRRGGHLDWLRSGENGFLFDSQEEAYDLLIGLRDDAAKRLHIGEAARASVEELYGAKALDKRRRWYLSGRITLKESDD